MLKKFYYHKIYIQPTILILDSGMGGLSIYTEIRQLLPYVRYIYFFDNQAFPYGERSAAFIIQRVISIIKIIKNIHHINLIIIACNTASVVALKILKNHFQCPIVGVIPAIKLASKYTRNKIIGILATHRTINHHCTLNLIKRFTYKYKIMLLSASKLVNIAESKIYGEHIQISTILHKTLTPWLKNTQFPDTIVLGCTHFSLLKQELIQILPKNSHLIDPTNFIAKYSIHILHKHTNIATYKNTPFNKNQAYCSLHTKKIIQIKSILLLHYHFFSLETLSII